MPRPLSAQTVVITGASSGIGREAAVHLGRHGAAVVLAARNARALEEAAAEVEATGGRSEAVPTDVADWDQVEALAARAVERFGGLHTWVNAAAVTEYAPVEDTTPEEMERLIGVDLLGQMYGSKAALSHMKRQRDGTIVNVSSVVGRQPVPLQSAYCTAKAGIIAFSAVLRMELEHEGSGVSVTTLLPPTVNTPLYDHARSKLGVKPRPPPPVYDPAAVAESIVFAAEHPRREIVVGGAAKGLTTLASFAPSLVERLLVLGGTGFRSQRTDVADEGVDTLFDASADAHAARGSFAEPGFRRSLYTRVFEHHPNVRRAALAGVVAAILRR